MGRAAFRDPSRQPFFPAEHGTEFHAPGWAVAPRRDPDAERRATPRATRMDMHCHSRASNGPATAALGYIGCPECYSQPEKVYEQAMARGMDLVTITDHDTIAGVLELAESGFERFVIGEEVTVHFPEDRCRLHVLVWGLTPEQHEEIGRLGLRDNVYDFAAWLADDNLPHSLAHPLYIQNGKLTREHVEKCVLLFKCFETLNGAHAGLHRGTLDRFIATLTPATVQALANKHNLRPLWPRVWDKGCTGGSDDHALLNVGRTWTAIASDDGRAITDPRLFLKRVMSAKCEPGGAAGHSSLLAHQLATVGTHYAARKFVPRMRATGRAIASVLMRFAGVEVPRPSRLALAADLLRARVGRWRRGRRASPIVAALRETIGPLLEKYPDLRARFDPASWTDGAALAVHERMAEFVDDAVAAAGRAIATPAAAGKRRRGHGTREILDAAGSYALLLAAQLPYIVSLFQPNKERPFLDRFDHETSLMGTPSLRDGLGGPSLRDGTPPRSGGLPRPMRVCLFTDTLGDVNGVSRFIQNTARQARESGRDLTVLTSTRFPVPDWPNIRNFDPIFAGRMPRYENLELVLPPVLKMLREADRLQPDVIHVSTPGPVGTVGLIAAKMLRCPVLGVYHTDFPAYIEHLFDDAAFTWLSSVGMRAFYSSFARIFARSEDYRESLVGLGVARERLLALQPGIDIDAFHIRHRDPSIWDRLLTSPPPHLPTSPPVKVLSVGRVSVEKNLPLLTKVWKRVDGECRRRGLDARLIVVGDGPYRARMEEELRGCNVAFLGFRHGRELSTIYASGDLFVFPSTTDTLGQVVMEAQSSGLPVIVSDKGGPKEVVDQARTGFVLSSEAPDLWVRTLVDLIADEPRRKAMGAAAHEAMQRMSFRASFEHFWRAHEEAWHDHLGALGITPGRAGVEHAEPVGA